MIDTSKAFIATYTGKKFFLLEPRIEDIDVIDIAHSLAMQCRWTGHCRHHYSIAQHAYYCSLIGPEEEAFQRLHHDDSEAYIADMNRPLKHYTEAGAAYKKVEKPLQDLIYDAMGLSRIEHESVHLADHAMLYAEKSQIMGYLFDEAEKWTPDEAQANIKIEQWTPEYAEHMYLKRHWELQNRRIN